MKNQPHPILLNFLEKRLLAKIKTEVKSSDTDEKQALKKSELREKFAFAVWVPNAAKRAYQISLTTHPAKFTNPDAGTDKQKRRTTSIFYEAIPQTDGYLYSDTAQGEVDVVGNAAALDVYQFLKLEIEGKSFLEHLEQNTDLAQASLKGIPDVSYEELRTNFLKIKSAESQPVTNTRLKQVYFPLSSENTPEYHLLSLLSPSGLVYGLRSRIDEMKFSEETKEVRELRKSKTRSDRTFRELYSSVTLGLGGTKPQNISVLNSQKAGRVYLLNSSPPPMKKRSFPTKNFFDQSIAYTEDRSFLEQLHAYLCDSRNNMEVRQRLPELLENFITYHIADKVAYFRACSDTEYFAESSKLPSYQKVWLVDTPENETLRTTDQVWREELVTEFVKWIVSRHEGFATKVKKKKEIYFSKAEKALLSTLLLQNETLFEA